MKSPFYGNQKAFEPFYDEELVVTTKGGQRQTVKAFVAIDNTADAIADEMLDTEEEQIAISFNRSNWDFLGDLKRGDTIERTCHGAQKKYSVQEVKNDFALGFIVIAKSV